MSPAASGRPGFGFSVTPGSPIGVGAEMAEAEALGYDRLGIWDSPALFREPWVTLASVARDTKRIRLGTWVTNPVSRHPLVTASAMATLEDLAPGRTYLGIGAGGTGVWHLGAREATLDTLRAHIGAIRGLLGAGRAMYGGAEARMEWGRGLHVPIIMSAHGPRSLRLAGEVADGVVVGLGITPEVVRGSLALIAEGAERAGRSLD
jgi:5,10-methylenetetrahydromethanopterin reductase